MICSVRRYLTDDKLNFFHLFLHWIIHHLEQRKHKLSPAVAKLLHWLQRLLLELEVEKEFNLSFDFLPLKLPILSWTLSICFFKRSHRTNEGHFGHLTISTVEFPEIFAETASWFTTSDFVCSTCVFATSVSSWLTWVSPFDCSNFSLINFSSELTMKHRTAEMTWFGAATTQVKGKRRRDKKVAAPNSRPLNC